MLERNINPDRSREGAARHIDAVSNMLLRRNLNENFAEEPIDFYAVSLELGQQLLGRPLMPDDLVVDIGGSHGDLLRQALIGEDIDSRAICVEPSEDAKDWYGMLPVHLPDPVLFIQGTGEALSIHDDSAQGIMMHNVIFRATDPVAMLMEASRVVEPGGFIAISTNVNGHAEYRHRIEKQAARMLIEKTGVNLTIPEPPAAGKYLANLPNLLKAAGLYVIPGESRMVPQDTYTVINAERLMEYRSAIYASAHSLDIADNTYLFGEWRRMVDKLIDTEVAPSIAFNENGEFRDPIKRGLYVFVNRKPSRR